MAKYVCTVCGYVYDPEVGDPDNGIAPGTPWEQVPEDWRLLKIKKHSRDNSTTRKKRVRHIVKEL